MNIHLLDCPPIEDVKAFFKAKSVVYINLFEAPVKVSPTKLKLIKIYETPGKMYRYFKKGYLAPADEETGFQPLILWTKPLQEILNSQRVFDFSAWDPQKDKILLTRHEFLNFLPSVISEENKIDPHCKN
jgi:hypothetical protein